ncbi:hypothetical protein QLQ85_14125 [Halomonas sp. M4R5S39]|uniref:hypothetical protein n=1 Tax=Halomonas kalidii TaxID=3043293 RepID=UPI0024A8AF0A|nr:hypothetical protein [Halomonas kalidii]MDI5985930.1 hypothetical protein [Halomonas kalidii]
MKRATTVATVVMTAILILGQACAMRNNGPFILTEVMRPLTDSTVSLIISYRWMSRPSSRSEAVE